LTGIEAGWYVQPSLHHPGRRRGLVDMGFNPEKHHRRSTRLRDHDYSQHGTYFITICTKDRRCLLGEIQDGVPLLSPIGRAAERHWFDLPNRFPCVVLDAFVVMPDHIHGILVLTSTADSPERDNAAQPASPMRSRLGPIVGAYKSLVHHDALEAAERDGVALGRFWQRAFWDRIIQNERELASIRAYILGNPQRWSQEPRDRPRR
jgi:putative transposase